ncbi:hypothetical protein OM416_19340 [Paenibacillus sp. LS1]|uniref:hypothetical protein n=1 Tax=Paenibacillus sp. LS1 TaxID=2992120 RepID=UPI00222EA836|nr:hypothetical protein [Paenibacillus sp. LS1]MCW3793751.1 hypothetical protein [Paenibacillus sp. LS1]
MSENIEKIIMDDSKSKKRTANSSFNRVKSGKRGMVTAYSMMSKADQREYTKTNDGPNYNVYEEIVPVSYLSQLPQEIRLKCWSKWNELFFLEDIMKVWCIQTSTELNGILEQLEIPLNDLVDDNSVNLTSEYQIHESASVLSLEDLIADDSSSAYVYNFSGVYEVEQVLSQLKTIMEDLKKHQNKCEVQIQIKTV